MPYEAERGSISIALGGDILLSRGMQVYREPEFLRLRDLLRNADACFANLETSVLRYGEGIPAVRTGTHMVTEPELLDDLKFRSQRAKSIDGLLDALGIIAEELQCSTGSFNESEEEAGYRCGKLGLFRVNGGDEEYECEK